MSLPLKKFYRKYHKKCSKKERETFLTSIKMRRRTRAKNMSTLKSRVRRHAVKRQWTFTLKMSGSVLAFSTCSLIMHVRFHHDQYLALEINPKIKLF